MFPALTFAPEVQGRIRVAWIAADPVEVGATGAELLAELERTREELRARHAGQAPADVPGLQPARELYRRFGIDPTKTRPSSEALFRRLVAGKPWPRVSSAVDLCNLLAVRFLLPIGLYDARKIGGAVTLRRGAAGESYPGIRKDAVHLAGRPVLADEGGPFGNPTADSWRACIDAATAALWMVVFAPPEFPREQLERHGAEAAAAIARHLGGRPGLSTRSGALG
ncbi:MAG TPA: phenylalanine--tRNA ligase beta subunit-related protein [Candidatus Polarisedimenticolaceae bacterium]|nr:phenylalanine--tRNA ligase beta subunit-related protein [Candidatus Polarisedimenticolaceae bacterium]